MKAKGYFGSAGGVLVALDDIGQRIIWSVAKRRNGALVDVHTPRNPRHHRLMFALLNEVIEAGAWDGSTDALLIWCKVAAGHVETTIGPTGELVYIPKSIRFEAMDQTSFNRFFDAAISAVCTRLLVGADAYLLRMHIEQQVDRGHSQMRCA